MVSANKNFTAYYTLSPFLRTCIKNKEIAENKQYLYTFVSQQYLELQHNMPLSCNNWPDGETTKLQNDETTKWWNDEAMKRRNDKMMKGDICLTHTLLLLKWPNGETTKRPNGKGWYLLIHRRINWLNWLWSLKTLYRPSVRIHNLVVFLKFIDSQCIIGLYGIYLFI